MFFQGFLYFWGYVFMISTTLVAIFKHEKKQSFHQEDHDLNLYQTYRLLGDIMKLPSVKSLSIVLLTAKVNTKDRILFNLVFNNLIPTITVFLM